MATSTARDPLVEELMATEGKAEIVDGRIECFPPHGALPARAIGCIVLSLMAHEKQAGGGYPLGSTAAFLCDLPNRGSFCPDVSFYTGPDEETLLGPLPEPPVFAVEVRSKNDYGPRAERAIHAKIGDYFAAGTLVVWDVDLLGEEVIAKYSAPNTFTPQIFKRGEIADAAPAVPGWTMPVDALFGR